MGVKAAEVNYKKDFCIKYFDNGCWDLDVLHEVDVHLKSKKDKTLLYIETKDVICNKGDYRKALAQTILTNKKQDFILDKVALVYRDNYGNDCFDLIDCSDNSIMYNNDINWKEEKASQPSKDAIDRINDRIAKKITHYENDEIFEIYEHLKSEEQTVINITENNVNVVFNQWKNSVQFIEEISDEQDVINLFLVDMLNNTNYKTSVKKDIIDIDLFGSHKIGEKEEDTDKDLIREGTNLYRYELIEKIVKCENDNEQTSKEIYGIVYLANKQSLFYRVKDVNSYYAFWKKYKRPPEKNEFLKILEHSAILYSDKYRKTTGGEYTPTCFVEKQVQILNQNYDMNEFVVFDPCAGVGNLENQFGKDYKEFCYLSTLDQMDVDTCKLKGFQNSLQFNYLENNEQPKFYHLGTLVDIKTICEREKRKLMVIMNPPYQIVKGKKNNLAIEFFNKVLDLKPQVIVFYYFTESFLKDEIEHYINSKYKIISHIFSNAETTFHLKNWSISQIIFDKEVGQEITKEKIKADRYELEKDDFHFIKTYTYKKLDEDEILLDDMNKKIKENRNGAVLGNYAFTSDSTISLTNKISKGSSNIITTSNLKYCLLCKGINFNTHNKYFERTQYLYKGTVKDIPKELFNDSIMMSLFYKNCAFTNKKMKNYIMPFSAEELGCDKSKLNILYPNELQSNLDNFNGGGEEQSPFDFRMFLKQFSFSQEAKKLYDAALTIFKYYHNNKEYENKDWNDSYYDITNAIMGKNVDSFQRLSNKNDTRISKTKTTKGTQGFGKHTIKNVINSKDLPIFTDFFDARDVLAKKINKQLVATGLLLWERENIY